MRTLRLAAPAERDIAALLDRSARQFGPSGRRRYEILIETALHDIAADPYRPGSRAVPDLGRALRIHRLSSSRDRAAGAVEGAVRSLRHLIAYRLAKPNLVVVLRVLHDAMDLLRHLLHEIDED